MSGSLLIAGTTSDAGKSLVVAGLCRLLARKGVQVAPFKAQNMSNNSAVTVEGGEIGRAQAMQARAAGVAPSVRFNPILLKPGSDRTSQLVVRGRVAGAVGAADYFKHRDRLVEVVTDELASLRSEFDAVICEGAGSPAEINLRATDLANMGLARAAHLPVIVVGDIDRGGLLAHLFGTVAVLEPEDQRTDLRVRRQQVPRRPRAAGAGADPAAGNSPAGPPTASSRSATASGSTPRTRCRCSRTASSAIRRPPRGRAMAAGGGDPAAAHLQFDGRRGAGVRARGAGALGHRPGRPRRRRRGRHSRQQGHRDGPGRGCGERGLADGSRRARRARRPVLGICGGFQMLCRRIDDTVESGVGRRRRARVCSTRTSCSPPTRRCVVTKFRCTDTRSITGRSCRVDRGRLARGRNSPRRGLRHALARTARQRRGAASMAHRRRGGRGSTGVRGRRRRRCRRAPRRATRPDGRPADQPRRRRRDDRPAAARPAGLPSIAARLIAYA